MRTFLDQDSRRHPQGSQPEDSSRDAAPVADRWFVGDLTDVELWVAARDGDADAFGMLFVRHQHAVYNFAFRLTASWDAAEDLVSETFLQAWRRRQDVTPLGDDAVPLLLGFTAGCARNYWRGQRRRRALVVRVPPPHPEPDPSGDLIDRLDAEQTMPSSPAPCRCCLPATVWWCSCTTSATSAASRSRRSLACRWEPSSPG
jgi:Sigma-70 region 2